MTKLSMIELDTVAGAGTCYGIQYNYDFSQNKVQGGLPILTIVGLKAEF